MHRQVSSEFARLFDSVAEQPHELTSGLRTNRLWFGALPHSFRARRGLLPESLASETKPATMQGSFRRTVKKNDR
jgi:hypothetical protein